METIHVAWDGCCSFAQGNRMLWVGEEGVTIFKQWLESCSLIGSFEYDPDMTVLGVFCDYLEDRVEPSDLRDSVILWYRKRMTQR
jgi:hypothetical protein